jgi:hypothetical protein
LLVRGDERDLKPYLAGCAAAASLPRIVFADEAGFQIRALRERIRHHGEVVHVIVEEPVAPHVRTALAAAAPRYHFEIKQERTLEHARFEFKFETPSRDVAAKLKALLGALPRGLKLANYAPEEKTDREASSTELYTPEHDYQFAGGGEISGGIFAVVDFRAALCAIDFTHCDEIFVDGV